MTTQMEHQLITAREAEAYIPPLDQFAGCSSLRAKLLKWFERPISNDGNLLIEGDPGTGKTSILIAYLRHQFANPSFYCEHVDRQTVKDKAEGFWVKSVDETREWQANADGRIYFKQVNGATDSESVLRSKLEEIQYVLFAQHRVLLVDELGELYFRGLEEMLRPILTESGISVYATAQNFHSKRKTDSFAESDQRLSALLRRFSHREATERPNESEHLRFLAFLVCEWQLKLDDVDTLRLLVSKSDGIVGLTKRVLIRAIDEHDRRLTRQLVEEADVDPR